MIAALKYEWTRLVTIRSTYWLIGGTLALYFVLTLILALTLDPFGGVIDQRYGLAGIITLGASTGFAPLLMAYILGIIGVFSMGHEYRHGMIRATLTSVPNRFAVVTAKAITVAVVAALASLAASLIGIFNAALFSSQDLPVGDSFTWRLVLGIMVYTALFAVAGLTFAGLVRNQTGAIVLLLAVPTLVENILQAILLFRAGGGDDPGPLATVAKYLPFDAGGKLYTRAPISDLIDSFAGIKPFEAVGGGIVLAVFVGVLLAAMTALFLRRDA